MSQVVFARSGLTEAAWNYEKVNLNKSRFSFKQNNQGHQCLLRVELCVAQGLGFHGVEKEF